MKVNLDYTDPQRVVNFRDVGEFINLIANRQLLPVNKLYRGGTIKYIQDVSVIESPKTIFCLQKGPDPNLSGSINFHFPISNDYEKYHTNTPEVRMWLRNIVKTIEAGIEYPLYVHCLSGKDRTGIVVACLLKILEISEEHILQEYYLSLGTDNNFLIKSSLDGFRDIRNYFSGINLDTVKNSLFE